MEESKLAAVEEFAELQFAAEEICVLIEEPEDVFTTDAEASRRFWRGRLKAQAEVRRSILESAKQGATPAQKEFMGLCAKSDPGA